MKKSIVVMQPTFLPWIGYFDLIDQSDMFVFYNDVQFVKQSWQARNRLNSKNGLFFINSFIKKTNLGDTINQVYLDNSKPWRKKLIKTLFFTYQKTPFFEEVHPWLTNLLQRVYDKLECQNIEFIEAISEKIGLQAKFIKSSNLQIVSSDRIYRLIEICKKLNGSIYLSTLGAKEYLENENAEVKMSNQGIELKYHHYKPLTYYSSINNFVPYMSVIDLLYNEGFTNSLNIIRAGRYYE